MLPEKESQTRGDPGFYDSVRSLRSKNEKDSKRTDQEPNLPTSARLEHRTSVGYRVSRVRIWIAYRCMGLFAR